MLVALMLGEFASFLLTTRDREGHFREEQEGKDSERPLRGGHIGTRGDRAARSSACSSLGYEGGREERSGLAW